MEEDFLKRGPMGRAPPRDACQEVWEEGYKVVDANLLYKTSMPCFSKPVRWPDGKRYLVLPPPPPEKKEEKSLYELYVYGMPILKDVGGLPQGVYTWILYKTRDNPAVQLAIAQVDSPLEIGVNHSALAMRVKATTIHGAGELLVEIAGVYFNLESGTFTLNWLGTRDGKRSCDREEFEEYLKARFVERAPIAVYREKTYISALQFTKASLELYAGAGFIIMEMPPGLAEGKDRNGVACSNFVGDYLHFFPNPTPKKIDEYLETRKGVIKQAFKEDTADKARFTALFSVLGLPEERIRQLVQ
jgi:hypothetical protein